MLEVGRLCMKTAGREAGKVCCIVKKIDDNFVMITGPREATGIKRRRCSILHLEPLKEKISITADAQDNDILSLYQKGRLFAKLNIKRTSIVKAEAEKRQKIQKKEEDKKKEGKKEKKKPVPKETKKEPVQKKETPKTTAKK